MTAITISTLAILLLPFVGFVVNMTLGRTAYISKRNVSVVAFGVVALSFFFSLFLFFDLSSYMLKSGVNIQGYTFLKSGNFELDMGILVDSLSLLFMLIITGIGSLIHLFSVVYMEEEKQPSYARYFAYLNLFIFFMLLLVMGNNLVVTFIGWEGVGLSSYLLIGFWFDKSAYVGAANKAFIMNRIGDLALLTAGFLLVHFFNTLHYASLESAFVSASLSPEMITAIGLLLFFAATGKSAQIPLFTWLPDAMAGPTPVSALIHAATMVTAGIFLMVRFFYVVNLSATLQEVMLVIGSLTAFLTATTATVQKDIKKVLAYSTVSQLGFMVAALGATSYVSSVFHVFTHAFFKALLFLGSGSIIYALHHEQLLEKMGGLRKFLPVTHLTFLVGCLSIAGLPPFSGFFSKDEILANLYHEHLFFYVILQATALLTTFYMFRLYALTFLGNYRGKMDTHHIKEGALWMQIPLVVLALGALVVGWLGAPEVFSMSHLFRAYLSRWFTETSSPLAHSTEWGLMAFAVGSSLVVMVIALWMYGKKKQTTKEDTPSAWGDFLFNAWYVDVLYKKGIVLPLYAFSRWLYYQWDVAMLRNFPSWVEMLSLKVGGKVRRIQVGYTSIYLLWMVVFLSVVLLFFAFIF